VKAMDNGNGRLIGIICGLTGGMSKYLLQINEQPYLTKLFQAGVTALICGLLGAAGKHLYDLMKRKYLKRK
jgi:hypothetical protein